MISITNVPYHSSKPDSPQIFNDFTAAVSNSLLLRPWLWSSHPSGRPSNGSWASISVVTGLKVVSSTSYTCRPTLLSCCSSSLSANKSSWTFPQIWQTQNCHHRFINYVIWINWPHIGNLSEYSFCCRVVRMTWGWHPSVYRCLMVNHLSRIFLWYEYSKLLWLVLLKSWVCGECAFDFTIFVRKCVLLLAFYV